MFGAMCRSRQVDHFSTFPP